MFREGRVTDHLQPRESWPGRMRDDRHWRKLGTRWLGLLAVVGLGLTLLLILGHGSPSWATEQQSTLHQTMPTATPGPTPRKVNITLQVALQRPNATPPSPAYAVPVSLALYPPGDAINPSYEWDLPLDQHGQWAGTLTLVTGVYDARIKSAHTLRNVRRNVTIATTTVLDMGALHEGDANNDNNVRIEDFAILRKAYFTKKGETYFDPRADFDEDDRILITDFALLRLNYFQIGDIEVGAMSAAARTVSVAPVDLSLDLPAAQVRVGDIVMVTVTANSGTQDIVGVEFDVHFDPSRLQVVDTAGQPATRVLPAGSLAPISNTVDAATGLVRYSAGTLGAARGAVPIAVIPLRALASTTLSALHLSGADIVASQGHSVLGTVRDATIVIAPSLPELYLPLVSAAED